MSSLSVVSSEAAVPAESSVSLSVSLLLLAAAVSVYCRHRWQQRRRQHWRRCRRRNRLIVFLTEIFFVGVGGRDVVRSERTTGTGLEGGEQAGQ